MALGPTDHSIKGAHRGALSRNIKPGKKAQRAFEPVWRYNKFLFLEPSSTFYFVAFAVSGSNDGQFLKGASSYNQILFCLFYKNLLSIYHMISFMSIFFVIYCCIFYYIIIFI